VCGPALPHWGSRTRRRHHLTRSAPAQRWQVLRQNGMNVSPLGFRCTHFYHCLRERYEKKRLGLESVNRLESEWTYTSPRKPSVARRSGESPADSRTYAAVNKAGFGGVTSSAAMYKAPPTIRTGGGSNTFRGLRWRDQLGELTDPRRR
jgi:hypothetical protein